MISNGIHLPVVALFLAAGLSFLAVGVNGEVPIGPLMTCKHGLKGEVFAKSSRELIIKGFSYDGKGPGAWFHGQLKGATEISTTDKFVTLPFPGEEGKCEKLAPGTEYDGSKEITIILPRSIKEFATIGVVCYKACANFGHVKVPETLEVEESSSDLIMPQCDGTIERTKEEGPCTKITPHKIDSCEVEAGAPAMPMMPGAEPSGSGDADKPHDGPSEAPAPESSGSVRLTFVPGWLFFTMFLASIKN